MDGHLRLCPGKVCEVILKLHVRCIHVEAVVTFKDSGQL